MKNRNLFYKMPLYIGIAFIISILILFILGRINREGYLSDINLNAYETLKLNNLDIESTKELFTIYDKLDYSSLTNYIFTNINISKYSYNFRISYYSKVFRNSDIYTVYLDTNNMPDYIKHIEFQEKGSPFGFFISDRAIETNIDNIKYSLGLKIINILIIQFLLSIFFFLVFKVFIFIVKFIGLNNNFRNKYAYILIIFLCFLIMPAIVYKVFYDKFDHFNYESRYMSNKPVLSLNNLSSYPSEYEKHFNDYIPFRNELVQLKNMIDIFVFHYILDDLLLLGKHNWLFVKGDGVMEQYLPDDKYVTREELEIMTENLISFRDELSKSGIDFILMVCSYKQFIYEEYMPDYIKRKSTISATDKILEYITNNTNIKVVHTKDNLLKYKDKYQLYFKYDTHWNYLGGYVGYMSLMDMLKFPYENIDNLDILTFNGIYENKYKYNGVYNDIARMLSLNKFDFYNDDYYCVISNYLKEKYFFDVPNTGMNHFKTFSSNDNPINKKLFIIRDSYAHNMIDYISSGFNEVTYVNSHIQNDYTSILNENPDIVIYEIVEVALKNRLINILNAWKIE